MKWMRATTKPSFLDYVDLLSRGGTEEWQEIYAEAKQNQRVRALVEEALAFVDPEIGEAKALWGFLLDNMPPVGSAEPIQEQGSPLRERLRRIASP
jgi:hypothetical protein